MKNFNLDKNAVRVLENIRIQMGLKDDAEVLRRAITLLKIASDNDENGGKLYVEVHGVKKEIVL